MVPGKRWEWNPSLAHGQTFTNREDVEANLSGSSSTRDGAGVSTLLARNKGLREGGAGGPFTPKKDHPYESKLPQQKPPSNPTLSGYNRG